MTITNHTCISLTCNSCGEVFEYDGVRLHFDTLGEAQTTASEHEWVVHNDGTAFCTKTLCSPLCECDDCDDEDCPGYDECPKCPRHGEVTA